METIVLIGAEDVQRAGSTMRDAATEMSRAAETIREAFSQQQRFMDDWLMRLEVALEKKHV